MIMLTSYGREVFWLVTIILLLVLGGWTGKKTAIVIVISMIVLLPVGVITKDVVARPRPIIPKSDYLIGADSEFGFPSGHALIVSAGAAVALLLFNNTLKRLMISLALAVEAALVCISRVYVGGHYPLDVIGGILLGVGVSLIFVGADKSIESIIDTTKKNNKKIT
jgi:membrane-associated phospholipid phosphatase